MLDIHYPIKISYSITACMMLMIGLVLGGCSPHLDKWNNQYLSEKGFFIIVYN